MTLVPEEIIQQTQKTESEKLDADYQEINPAEGRIAFIDTGSAEITKTSSYALALAKLYYSIYDGTKKEKGELKQFLIFCWKEYSKIKCRCYGENFETEFEENDATLKQGMNNLTPSQATEHARKLIELTELAKLSKQCIAIRDGDLETKATQEKEILANAGTIAGLAKTSTITTPKGNNILFLVCLS